MIRRFSISYCLFALMLAVAVIAASVAGYVQFVSAKKNAAESLAKRLGNDMRTCSECFTYEYSMGIERALADIESSPGLDHFLSSPAEESVIYLLDEEKKFQWRAKQTHGCVSISFIGRDGKEIISVSSKKRIRHLVSIFESKEEYHKREANLFGTLKTMPSGTVLFDKPFRAGDRTEFIAGMAKSDPEVGGFAGVIMLRMDLSIYIAYLSSKRESDNSLLWLFDAEGGTILAPENRTVSPDPSPVIFGNSRAAKNNMVFSGDIMAGQPQHIFLKLAFSASQEVFSSLTANIVRNTLVVILLALTVSSLIAYFAARWFVKPIVDLAHACKGIGKGDFSAKIPAIGGMEMQELANAFNQMTENLESMTVSRDIFQKEKDRAQNYLDVAEVMLLVLDCQGRVTMINRRGCELLGYPESDIIGKNWFDFFLPENSKLNAGQVFSKLLKKDMEHVKYVENSILSSCGGEKDIAWHNTVLSNKDGDVIGIMSSGEDITERKKAETELIETNRQLEAATARAVQANTAKSRFLAHMSHEIRTPLNAILGFSQLLQYDLDLTASQKQRVETINRSGEHLLALLNDILELSKIEAGALTLVPTSFDLRELLQDLVIMFRTRAQAKNLTLSTHGLELVPRYLIADEQKLRQVLINLLSNAVKYTVAGGICLRAALEQEAGGEARLLILVEDSGLGISAEEMKNLFTPFEQTATGRNTGTGTGLGLAISRQFAQLMGGDVSVTSEAGKGSVFRLEIPVKEGVPVIKNDIRQILRLEPDQPCFRILVAEDDYDSRLLLVQMLGDAGFEVFEASNGQEAVAVYFSSRPQLILMDNSMPLMRGDEAIRHIRQSAGGTAVKIITLTANASEETRQYSEAAGSDDFMGKPFRHNELFEKIRLLCGVRYVYAESPEAKDGSAEQPPTLSREMMDSLPDELKLQLRTATISCRHEQLLKLIQQVTAIAPEIGGTLRAMAMRFDYDALIQLLN